MFESIDTSDIWLGCAGATAPLLQPASSSSTPANVLVLEDDAVLLQILSRHLESIGLKVIPASTCSEARSQLETVPVQLAILDIHLPDGSGLDLCANIDEDTRLMGLPVIVLSSVANDNIVRQTRASGGRFFISKPYDPNVLLAIVERSLSD